MMGAPIAVGAARTRMPASLVGRDAAATARPRESFLVGPEHPADLFWPYQNDDAMDVREQLPGALVSVVRERGNDPVVFHVRGRSLVSGLKLLGRAAITRTGHGMVRLEP